MTPKDFVRALLHVEPERVLDLAARVASDEGLEVRHRTVPQQGLGMLTLRDSALGEPFHLGEFPLTVVQVELADPAAAGGAARLVGAASVMTTDEELAVGIAVLDAVHRGGGADGTGVSPALLERLDGLLADGRARARDVDARRASLLERTTVDFDLLEASDHRNTEGGPKVKARGPDREDG